MEDLLVTDLSRPYCMSEVYYRFAREGFADLDRKEDDGQRLGADLTRIRALRLSNIDQTPSRRRERI